MPGGRGENGGGRRRARGRGQRGLARPRPLLMPGRRGPRAPWRTAWRDPAGPSLAARGAARAPGRGAGSGPPHPRRVPPPRPAPLRPRAALQPPPRDPHGRAALAPPGLTAAPRAPLPHGPASRRHALCRAAPAAGALPPPGKGVRAPRGAAPGRWRLGPGSRPPLPPGRRGRAATAATDRAASAPGTGWGSQAAGSRVPGSRSWERPWTPAARETGKAGACGAPNPQGTGAQLEAAGCAPETLKSGWVWRQVHFQSFQVIPFSFSSCTRLLSRQMHPLCSLQRHVQ